MLTIVLHLLRFPLLLYSSSAHKRYFGLQDKEHFPGAIYPTLQEVQKGAPTAELTFLSSHAWHVSVEVAPVVPLYVPVSQLEQEPTPKLSLNFSAGQVSHSSY